VRYSRSVGDIADALRQAVADGEAPIGRSRDRGNGHPTVRVVPSPQAEPEWVETKIPTSRDDGWRSRAVWLAGQEGFAESFRHLALRVRGACEQRRTASVLITSAVAQEGKTLTACNLALGLASMETSGRIALVELDLRAPRVAASLGIDPPTGFERVLTGDAPLTSAAVHTEASLDVYAVAEPVRDAHEVLVRPSVAESLDQLTSRYSFVVCDTPPVLPVPDVELLLPHVGACCVVVRSGRTSRSALTDLVDRLPRHKLIGCFLNDARVPRHVRDYYTLSDGRGRSRSARGAHRVAP